MKKRATKKDILKQHILTKAIEETITQGGKGGSVTNLARVARVKDTQKHIVWHFQAIAQKFSVIIRLYRRKNNKVYITIQVPFGHFHEGLNPKILESLLQENSTWVAFPRLAVSGEYLASELYSEADDLKPKRVSFLVDATIELAVIAIRDIETMEGFKRFSAADHEQYFKRFLHGCSEANALDLGFG